MSLSEESREWFDQLRAFVERRRERHPLPEIVELEGLPDEQRRIAGGLMFQFFQFLQGESAFELFPVLEEKHIEERAFVLATDRPGAAAAHDIVEWESDRAIVVLDEEWKAWLDAPGTPEDEDFVHHYEFWSVWHRDVNPRWNWPDDVDGDLWVHEEGFAVADRAGRGSRHLWSWDGEELTLVEEAIEDWTSRPARES